MEFRNFLHRGGKYHYAWVLENKLTAWDKVERDIAIPKGKFNVFYGVHPTNEPKSASQRATIKDVACINVVFADFDAKLFESQDAMKKRIADIPAIPSAVVKSGGGLHLFWFLDKTFFISDDETRQRAINLQGGWVSFVGGDKGAKDLARVLRTIGSYNHKECYAPNYPQVVLEYADYNKVYSIEHLEMLLPRTEKKKFELPKGTQCDKYLEKAITNQANRVLKSTSGCRNDTLNTSAFLLGRLIPHGLNRHRAEDMLLFSAMAIGLPEKEAARTIKSGLDSGERKQ